MVTVLCKFLQRQRCNELYDSNEVDLVKWIFAAASSDPLRQIVIHENLFKARGPLHN